MTKPHRRTLTLLCAAFLLTIALCADLHAAEKPPTKRPTALQITRAAEALGSHDRTKRVAAEALLKRAGPAALGALSEAAQSPNRIAAARAETIIEPIRLGISPDTPEDVAALARSYPDATREARITILAKLVTHGEHGLRVIRALAMSGDYTESVSRAAEGWKQCVLACIRECKLEEAEAILWMAAAAYARPKRRQRGPGKPFSDLATFLTVRGRAAEALTEVSEWHALGKSTNLGLLKAHLLGATGQYQKAAQAAADSNARLLQDRMQFLGGDWAALCRSRMALAGEQSIWRAPGYWVNAALCAYLAQNEKLLAEAQKGFRRALLARAAEEAKRPTRYRYPTNVDAEMSAMRARIGRGGDIVAPTLKSAYPHRALYALFSQGRIDDVRKLFPAIMKATLDLHKPRADDDAATAVGRKVQMLKTAARYHAMQGHHDEASQLLEQAAAAVLPLVGSDVNGAYWLRGVAYLEHSIGLHDRARAHFMAGIGPSARKGRSIHTSWVAGDPHESFAWWRFFSQRHPDETPGAALARVERVVSAQLPKEEFVRLTQAFIAAIPDMAAADLREADDNNARGQVDLDIRKAEYSALLARTCVRYQMVDAAIEHLQGGKKFEGGPIEHARQLVKMLWDTGRWADAARPLESMASAPGSMNAEELFLYGVTKVRAGRRAEGERLIEAARLLPLSTAITRIGLSRRMDWHGFPRAAARERHLVENLTVAPSSINGYFVYHPDIPALEMELAARAGDWRRFRILAERELIGAMQSSISSSPTRDLCARSRLEVARTGELLAAGKKIEAVQLAHKIADEMPLYPVAVAHLVRMFDRAGMREEADRIYEKSHAAFQATTKCVPGAASIWAARASMAQQCERDLDDALKAAHKAMALSPDEYHRELLAAVHLARKDIPKATALLEAGGRDNNQDFWSNGGARRAFDCWRMGQLRIALKKAEK